jgi:hypothetical protein
MPSYAAESCFGRQFSLSFAQHVLG